MNTIEDSKRVAEENLLKWRGRYHAEEYAYMVYINMFDQLFAIEGVWGEILNSFTHKSLFKDFQAAYVHLFAIVRKYQAETTSEMLLVYLEEDREAGGYRSSFFIEDVDFACEGDNEAVTDIEYGYWMTNIICTATIAWGAHGLMGEKKEKAFLEVSGGIFMEMKFETFGQMVNNFRRVFGARYDFVKDLSGKEIPIEKVVSGEVSNYYLIDFPFLDKLWP